MILSSAPGASASFSSSSRSGIDQAALSVLPAIAFFEAHSAPTFVLPLSAVSLRSATPIQSQEDCFLPAAVWSNAAASTLGSNSWLEQRLDDDGQRAIRGLLLALLWQLEQQDSGPGEETLGRTNGRKTSIDHTRTSTAPLLVRCHAGKASEESTLTWSTYVAATTLLPVAPPGSPSYFNGSISHPQGSSTSGNTPTQAGQAPTPMPGDGYRREPPSALVVLQLHPVPEPAVARSVPSQARRTKRSTKTAPQAGDGPASGSTGSAHIMRTAHHDPPTTQLGTMDADASMATSDGPDGKANNEMVAQPEPAAKAAPLPLQPSRPETREQKVARRKRKYEMKETIYALLADEKRTPIKKAEQTPVFKSALAIVLNTETESTLWWGDRHVALCA